MDFNEYQKLAIATAKYNGQGETLGLAYTALGLNGEAGEVAEKVKKLMRDANSVITPEFRAAVLKELGDVLWYVSACATELKLSLNDVAQSNIDKLASRKERGVLSGSGDNR